MQCKNKSHYDWNLSRILFLGHDHDRYCTAQHVLLACIMGCNTARGYEMGSTVYSQHVLGNPGCGTRVLITLHWCRWKWRNHCCGCAQGWNRYSV